FENIDPRITEDTKLRTARILIDELQRLLCRESARFGDARRLQLRVGDRDVRIKAGGGCRYSVDRNRSVRGKPVLFPVTLRPSGNCVEQLFADSPLVARTAGGGIVRLINSLG